MIKKFFKYNYQLIIINFIVAFNIFLINIIINPILINDFHFNEILLSYSNLFLSIGLFSGTLLFRYLLDYRVNFIYLLKKSILVFFIVILLYIPYIYFNPVHFNVFYQSLFLIFRFFEGILSGGIGFIIQFLIGYKLINNNFKGFINSLISSKFYFAKFIGPIIGSFLFLHLGTVFVLYYINLFFYFAIYIFLKKKYFSLNREYYRYLRKKHSFYKKSLKRFYLKNIFSFSFLKSIYKNNKFIKSMLLIEMFLQNSIRPFYDFYLILMLLHLFNFNLVEAGSLMSFFVFGQALSFKIGFLFDYLNNKINDKKLYSFIQTFFTAISQFTFFCIFIFLYSNLDNSFILNNKYLIFLVLLSIYGFIRNIYNDRMYRLSLNFAKVEGGLNNFKAALTLFSEIFNIFAYILTSIVFYFLSYNGVLYFLLFSSFLLLLKSFVEYFIIKINYFME
jgi:MFS family permease